jgi:hypothetical protein
VSRPQHLGQEQFLLGIGTLERYFRVKFHPTTRDMYYEAVREASDEKWEKVVQYATMRAKSMPKASELREWMGLPEPLSPAEEEGVVKGALLFGLTVAEVIRRVRAGEDFPAPEPWADELEKACYLDQPYAHPPPDGELTLEERLAWIRRYAELGAAAYERCKPQPTPEPEKETKPWPHSNSDSA